MPLIEDFKNFDVQYNIADNVSEPNYEQEDESNNSAQIQYWASQPLEKMGNPVNNDQADPTWPLKLESSKDRDDCNDDNLFRYHGGQTTCDSMGTLAVDAGVYGLVSDIRPTL
jgi:hypothetical protein